MAIQFNPAQLAKLQRAFHTAHKLADEVFSPQDAEILAETAPMEMILAARIIRHRVLKTCAARLATIIVARQEPFTATELMESFEHFADELLHLLDKNAESAENAEKKA